MDITNLTSLITALRAETAYAAITPESLGALLQKIADAIEKTSSDDDMRLVKAWMANMQRLSYIVKSAEQGSADRNNIYLTAHLANLATGGVSTSTDAIQIRQATTDRAGAMRAQQVIDLNTCKSDIRTLQAALTDLEAAVENLPSSLPSTTATATAYHIECDTKDDVLYIQGAKKLIDAGYKPFVFRYTLKKNRILNYDSPEESEYKHGPKRRGWHVYRGLDMVRINDNDSISFRYISNGNPTDIYATDPSNIMTIRAEYDDETGDVNKIKVGWGKKTINATKGRRFKFGIAFAPTQTSKSFDMSTLVTNIAPYSVHVRIDEVTGKCKTSLCL